MLQQILETLPSLFNLFGYFNPTNNTFGVNTKGITKIWVNKNHSKIKPDPEDVITMVSPNI